MSTESSRSNGPADPCPDCGHDLESHLDIGACFGVVQDDELSYDWCACERAYP